MLYASIFDLLVERINQSLSGEKPVTVTSGGSRPTGNEEELSIGLLDIYGFESFEFNDLEQLCINLANEKLQQHFNQHVFKWEQAEYIKEGIDWRHIAYEDNQDVLELIEGRLGLMTVLDEQCRLPRVRRGRGDWLGAMRRQVRVVEGAGRRLPTLTHADRHWR